MSQSPADAAIEEKDKILAEKDADDKKDSNEPEIEIEKEKDDEEEQVEEQQEIRKPKMKYVGVQKGGRKARKSRGDDSEDDDEFKPEKEAHDDEDGDEEEEENEFSDDDNGDDDDYDGGKKLKKKPGKRGRPSLKKKIAKPTRQTRNSKSKKSKDETDEEDQEEEYGSDYEAKAPAKPAKAKVADGEEEKPRTPKKRGRKPKSQTQIQPATTEDKEQAPVDATTPSEKKENGSQKEIAAEFSGRRATRTSSGKLPTHHEIYQPTFKKYKPHKKEDGHHHSHKDQENHEEKGDEHKHEEKEKKEDHQEKSDKQDSEKKDEVSNNGKHSESTANGESDSHKQHENPEKSEEINVKRPHSALENKSPAKLQTQADVVEDETNKKVKTDTA